MRTARVAVCTATATALLSISVAHAMSPAARPARASVPTLGVKPNHAGAGFGQVRPRTVDFGGDATSIASDVTWSSWGGKRAVGHGTALWVWPGWCTACGGVPLPATVVAFGRTTCHGHRAYSKVEWFFPSRGQSFNRRLAGEDICSWAPPPIGPFRDVKCKPVSLRSDSGVVALADHIDLYDSPISCEAARQFVAHSGAGRYLHRNARYTVNGWWCGSQLIAILRGVQYFTCQRGDFTDVMFQLKPAGA